MKGVSITFAGRFSLTRLTTSPFWAGVTRQQMHTLQQMARRRNLILSPLCLAGKSSYLRLRDWEEEEEEEGEEEEEEEEGYTDRVS